MCSHTAQNDIPLQFTVTLHTFSLLRKDRRYSLFGTGLDGLVDSIVGQTFLSNLLLYCFVGAVVGSFSSVVVVISWW